MIQQNKSPNIDQLMNWDCSWLSNHGDGICIYVLPSISRQCYRTLSSLLLLKELLLFALFREIFTEQTRAKRKRRRKKKGGTGKKDKHSAHVGETNRSMFIQFFSTDCYLPLHRLLIVRNFPYHLFLLACLSAFFFFFFCPSVCRVDWLPWFHWLISSGNGI